MKRQAGFYTLIALVAIFFFPQITFADNVSVNSQSTGQSTTCINGSCTTTGGGSKTTVCHNGQCTTTDDGNVDYSSPDGHTQIRVNNNTGGNTIDVSPSPEPTDISPSPEPSITLEPSITPDPTITQMRDDINKHVQKELEGIKEHMKDQNAAISDFIKTEMDALQNMLQGMFK
jgi:hypothetical protein